jgi:predicted Zn-ribbon and HTH transcriptional regulator
MLITEIERLRQEIQSILVPHGVIAQVNLTKQTLLIVLNRDAENQVDYTKITALLKDFLENTEIIKRESPKWPVYGDRKLTREDYLPVKEINEKDKVRILGRISKAPKSEFEIVFDLSSISKVSQSTITPLEVLPESVKVTTPTEVKIRCPRCHSSQIAPFQKGFGWGKAIGGALLFGPLGLAAGGIGSKKITVGCLSCGHKWMAGD